MQASTRHLIRAALQAKHGLVREQVSSWIAINFTASLLSATKQTLADRRLANAFCPDGTHATAGNALVLARAVGCASRYCFDSQTALFAVQGNLGPQGGYAAYSAMQSAFDRTGSPLVPRCCRRERLDQVHYVRLAVRRRACDCTGRPIRPPAMKARLCRMAGTSG